MKFWLRSAVFILIVVTSALIIYYSYDQMKHTAVNTLNDRQMLIARQTAKSIQHFFSEQHKMLRHFASRDSFQLFTDDVFDPIKNEYEYSKDYITAVTIYDSEGIIKFSYPNPELTRGRDISSQPHVRKILLDHKPNVSDVFMAVQGYQAVAISEPMIRDGKFIGVVAYLINFKYIAKTFLEGIRINNSGYAWMISRDGTELYCPIPGHTGVNVDITSSAFPDVVAMADVMKQGEEGVTTYTYNMIKDKKSKEIMKYAAYSPVHLEDNLWSIVIATPEKEVFAPLTDFYHKMLIAGAMLLLALTTFVIITLKDVALARRNSELEQMVNAEISKRQKQEQFVLQQARFYSMMETLNAIAHQWRQPLNSVAMFVQDLEDSFETGEMTKEYLSRNVEKTMDSLNRLSSTIDDFRNFFEESGEMTDINICGLIYNIHSIVRVQYDAGGINFTFKVDGKCSEHSTDCNIPKYNARTHPDMIKQILLNCLQNSRESIEDRIKRGYMTKGEITLSLSKDGDTFQVEITDNGGGIPVNIIDKIYDPYFSTKGTQIGMGLGLYTSKAIVEEHLNGTIKLENYKNGAKATIRFKSF